MTNNERRPADSVDADQTAGMRRRSRVDIPERTYQFSRRVLKVVDAIPKTIAGTTIARQLARCATAVGANVEEAQHGHSRREFARRMNIARSESRETCYWLRLIEDHGLLPNRCLAALRAEADEINRILTAIVKRTRSGND